MPEIPQHNPKNYYAQEAKHYADFADTSFSWEYIEKPAFDKHLTEFYKPTTRVLDLGCGSGRVVKHLITQGIRPKNIVGADISPEMLAIAQKNVPDVRFIEADISEGIATNETFDLVTCSLVIQHLDDKQLGKALLNIRDGLTRGGILFYLVAHPVRVIHGDLRDYFNTGWREQQNAWGTTMDYYHRTVSDYIARTLEAGFTVNAVDEPQIINEGKSNKVEYERYTANPTRLVVRAMK